MKKWAWLVIPWALFLALGLILAGANEFNALRRARMRATQPT